MEFKLDEYNATKSEAGRGIIYSRGVCFSEVCSVLHICNDKKLF